MTALHPLSLTIPKSIPSPVAYHKTSIRFCSDNPATSLPLIPNGFNKLLNWWWMRALFTLRYQKVGGKRLNKKLFEQKRMQHHNNVMQQIKLAEATHWDHIAKSVPLQKIGYQYDHGIPPSLVWAEPNASGLPLRQNTNGLIAKIFIDLLSDNNRFPPAASMAEAAAVLHNLRQGLSDLSMEKALSMPGVKIRSGGRLKQMWRHWFPELRQRCENIRQPFAYRLQGLAPGIFSVAAVKDKLYSMIQIHHLIFIADNGAILITNSPSYTKMIEMIQNDPKAQHAIDIQKPLAEEGWGFLPVPSKVVKNVVKAGQRYIKQVTPTRLGLSGTLALLQKQADKLVHYRSQNDWTDVETLLREVPFDLKQHIEAGRLRILMNKPGVDGKTVLDFNF